MKHTTPPKECEHDNITIIHVYSEFDIQSHYLLLFEDESEIGPELMRHAKICKFCCDDCKIVGLAKLFDVEEIYNNKTV